jgi:diphthine synthase
MLYIISLGLYDEKDISLRAIEAGKKCKELYVEFYTTGMHTTPKRLEKVFGKPVTKVERADLEDRMEELVKKAKTKNIGILVGGDALSATTHIIFLLEARKAGVKTEIIHGSSIFTAVTETGLQLYKFGRTVTLAFERPLSVYHHIAENVDAGLHSLVLLDIPMSAREGMKILMELEKSGQKAILKPETMTIAITGLGGKDQIIRYGPIGKLIKDRKLHATPAVVILPGELHFMEKDYLETL